MKERGRLEDLRVDRMLKQTLKNQKSKNQHMHYIFTSKSFTPTYVSASTSCESSVVISQHWTRSNKYRVPSTYIG
jgi:hypothetical protein